MLNLNSILVFSENPGTLLEFYKKVLQSEPEWSGGNFHGFKAGVGYLIIGPHDKVKGVNTHPERIIFNFETNDVEGEFKRIKGVGGKVVKEPYHPTEDEKMLLATLSDPDGNFFQLTSPME
ncbi:hypothetical protein A2960_02865 [Candidatus Gottesmanbacteria bacterium RIFCSPLOWO2_01_FULL_39_12b]|uniref:VOC domain-containing protein n=1 Tax=Candidatus Gottesmanbacteria bacterium RIFCSPLOWO2_01_FULL_39_12b TaxID=1798388 RepID=A0A1F6AQU1_9BACT|nr:MAG: hypothetical protein A2960_02865 [Candidatus Gottesmanbacteria bacterium RIFCSPLOWO2_01_FULL_39_12b]